MPGQDVRDPEDLLNRMRGAGGDSMTFTATRKRQDGKTFGDEALENLVNAMGIFVRARLIAHATRHRPFRGHESLKMTLTVEVDGETLTVPLDSRPWFIADGGARDAGRKV